MESVCWGNSTVGSNPTLSAISFSLTSTFYNYASQPTQVNFGSGDSDTFTYDSKSNRMTQYKFSVNGRSVTGTLTWNAIGTLETLAVTGPILRSRQPNLFVYP